MGKRYYCDYCDKSMVATPSIIRTHMKGIVHQKFVNEHYQKYKDPETIIKEETCKKPCLKFFSGECNFGGICRYSHYTQDEIIAMKEYVAAKVRKQSEVTNSSFEDLYKRLQDKKSTKQSSADKHETVVYDSCGKTHVLPWSYNPIFDDYGDNLPPSIRRLRLDDITNASLAEWGKIKETN